MILGLAPAAIDVVATDVVGVVVEVVVVVVIVVGVVVVVVEAVVVVVVEAGVVVVVVEVASSLAARSTKKVGFINIAFFFGFCVLLNLYFGLT